MSEYKLYIVKLNDGKTIRLADFEHILRYIQTGDKNRTEVLLTGLSKEDIANPMWQTHRMIWWRPLDPIYHEATMDDKRAVEEYNQVLKMVGTLPDINPLHKDSIGTLIMAYGDDVDVYRIVDGAARKTKWVN